MNRSITQLAAVALIMMGAVACTKDKNITEPQLDVVLVTNLPADTTTGFSATGRPIGNNTFTYVSLREGRVLQGADTLTNKWDVAFKQFYIKINGGTSATGGGNGAAYVAVSTFEDFKTIPSEAPFAQDNGDSWAINPMPGTWYTYSPATFLAQPIPGRVIVIRTADGRYAKMEILSFYRDGITPDVNAPLTEKAMRQFFYQLRYTFQPNGTRNF